MAEPARAERESGLAARFEEDRAASAKERGAARGLGVIDGGADGPAAAPNRPAATAATLGLTVLPGGKGRKEEADPEAQEQEEEELTLREQAQQIMSVQQQEDLAGGLEEARGRTQRRAAAIVEAQQVAKKKAAVRLLYGSGLIRLLWLMMAMSFYHTVYLLDLLFGLQALFPYFRKFIPEVGSEWGMTNKVGKVGMLGFKLAEYLALIFCTLYVLYIDVYASIILFFGAALWAFIIETGLDQAVIWTLEKLDSFFDWVS